MRFFKLLLIIFVLSLNFGCFGNYAYLHSDTEAQKEHKSVQSAAVKSHNEYKDCVNKIKSNKNYSIVFDKIIFDHDDKNKISMLTDNQSITDELKYNMKLVLSEYTVCNTDLIKKMAQSNNALAAFMAKINYRSDLIDIDMISGKYKTISEYNKVKYEFLLNVNDESAKFLNSYFSQLKIRHNSELKNRAIEIERENRALADALMLWSATQQQLSNTYTHDNAQSKHSKPSFSNCTVSGNNVHCTSY